MSEPRQRRFFDPDVARDVEDELASHIEMRQNDLAEAGLDPETAADTAARRFGNLAAVARECREIDTRWYRETGRTRMWRDFRQDIGYGLRLLARAPGFTTLAVLTLALGIGATTAIFSVVDAALLRPLPYPHPEQLVSLTLEERSSEGELLTRVAPSVTDIKAFREEAQVFSHLAIWRNGDGILDGPEPERISIRQISEEYLRLHGLAPVAGRDLTVDDGKAGAPGVALISHAFWQSRFGGDPAVVSRTIRVDDEPMTIVGVFPAGFHPDIEVWRPWATGSPDPRVSLAWVYGRLRPGISLDQAEARLAQVPAATEQQSKRQTERVVIESLLKKTTAGYTSTTTVLLAAVGAILLIACLNVAGLLLARGAVRRTELAIRASIGAGRMRLLRQLLTESLMLSVIGGAAGVVVAGLTLDILVANIPLDLPENVPVTLNPRVLAFAFGLSLLTGLLFGLLPALELSRTNVSGVLARADRRHGAALSRRGGQVLIASEVALALVLLAGAGLMIRSFNRVLSVDLGFDSERILAMDVEPVSSDEVTLKQYYPALVEALRQVPGVESAGAVDYFPMTGRSASTRADAERKTLNLHLRGVVAGYFETLQLPMAEGRAPTTREIETTARVIVLNEQAVRQLFGSGPAVGRHFNLRNTPYQVIGVVRDLRHHGPLFPPYPEGYLPYGTDSPRPATVVVRPRPDAEPLQPQLRDAARAVGPRVIVSSIKPVSEMSSEYVLTPRQRTVLLGVLGGLGLLLALVGVLAMTAYAVARRTQEIGVRLAFGASPRQVVRTMLRDSLWPVALGIAVGLGGAILSTKIIASFLFETPPTEPTTLAAVAAMLAVTACVAAWIPARRAALVDPVAALRAE
ncbi:MAG: ABC transporter permease [Vicinamibacterales bacterium]